MNSNFRGNFSFSCLFWLLSIFTVLHVSATSYEDIPLEQLVFEADHIVLGKVDKVEMVDGKGLIVSDPEATTGDRESENKIRLHISVTEDGLLKTNSLKIPNKFGAPFKRWFHKVEDWKPLEGKERIFLLKGGTFEHLYSGRFILDASKKQEVLDLIKAQSINPDSVRWKVALRKAFMFKVGKSMISKDPIITKETDQEVFLTLENEDLKFNYRVEKKTGIVFWKIVGKESDTPWTLDEEEPK